VAIQSEELVVGRSSGGKLTARFLSREGLESAPGLLVLVGPRQDPGAALEFGEHLAGEGYGVLLPELRERGDRGLLAELGLCLDALEAREELDEDRLGVLGFERGGTLAFLLACTRRLAASIDVEGPVLYPELSVERPTQPLELALNLEGAFLGVFGARSAEVPAEQIELLRARLSSAARPFDIVSAPEAQAGFYDRGRAGFDERLSEDLKQRITAFLGESLAAEE